jgi:hypothetical protein
MVRHELQVGYISTLKIIRPEELKLACVAAGRSEKKYGCCKQN